MSKSVRAGSILAVGMVLTLFTIGIAGQEKPAQKPAGQVVAPAQAKAGEPVPPAQNIPVESIFAGEFRGFKVNVSAANYNFVKSVILIFGTRWGGQPRNEDELEDQIWEQLLLSYESFNQGITVEQQELDNEISNTLSADKVTFDWKKDRNSYKNWVRGKTGQPVEVFENQLRHLIQIEKLRKKILEGIKPEVSEAEAKQEFLNEYNSLELELAQFDTLLDAQKFIETNKDPGSWEKKAKEDPKYFKHPGFVSLEFLSDIWKIPKDDLYKMLQMEVNSIYQPTAIYKGFGIFRILQKRLANEDEFPKMRDSYFKQVETKKKYDGLNQWIREFKAKADINPVWIVY